MFTFETFKSVELKKNNNSKKVVAFGLILINDVTFKLAIEFKINL